MKSYPIIFSALKLAFFQTILPMKTATIAKEVRVERLEVRVEGLEVRVEGLGVRVLGVGCWVLADGMPIKSARKNIDRAAIQSRVGNTVG